MERIIVSGLPESLTETIGVPGRDIHGHNTRGAGQRTLPHIRTEAGRRRLSYRGVHLMNCLALVPGTVHFKSSLKTVLSTSHDVF